MFQQCPPKGAWAHQTRPCRLRQSLIGPYSNEDRSDTISLVLYFGHLVGYSIGRKAPCFLRFLFASAWLCWPISRPGFEMLGNQQPSCNRGRAVCSLTEVPDYLAPAQEQGAIMIGVTGYPGKRAWARMLQDPSQNCVAKLLTPDSRFSDIFCSAQQWQLRCLPCNLHLCQR